MKVKSIISVVAAFVLASAASAGEGLHTKMMIAIDAGDSDGEVRIELDSDELGFSLHDMQEGESRSFVDKAGRNIFVVREADGFTFDVDGKTIKMPDFDGDHHASVWVEAGELGDVDVHIMRGADLTTEFTDGGVMIFSGKAIDDATQQAIQSLLVSAGYGSDVEFIDGAGQNDGEHHVKVIRKKIEIEE